MVTSSCLLLLAGWQKAKLSASASGQKGYISCVPIRCTSRFEKGFMIYTLPSIPELRKIIDASGLVLCLASKENRVCGLHVSSPGRIA
jgi:hypothetical protein